MHDTDKHGLHKLSTTTPVIAALGVVFGDIGISPIYTLKECFSPHSPHHIAASHEHIPRRDRRRGLVCRHGPLRRRTDPPWLVLARVSGARAQLPRSGRAFDAFAGVSAFAVFPNGPRLGHAAARAARHRRDRHRLASAHHRHLLAHAQRRAARLPAAPQHPPHLRARPWPDLHPAGELAAHARLSHTRRRLLHLVESRRRVWRGRDDDHAHHHHPVLLCRTTSVEVEPAQNAAVVPRVRFDRTRLPQRQPREILRWRLGSRSPSARASSSS